MNKGGHIILIVLTFCFFSCKKETNVSSCDKEFKERTLSDFKTGKTILELDIKSNLSPASEYYVFKKYGFDVNKAVVGISRYDSCYVEIKKEYLKSRNTSLDVLKAEIIRLDDSLSLIKKQNDFRYACYKNSFYLNLNPIDFKHFNNFYNKEKQVLIPSINNIRDRITIMWLTIDYNGNLIDLEVVNKIEKELYDKLYNFYKGINWKINTENTSEIKKYRFKHYIVIEGNGT